MGSEMCIRDRSNVVADTLSRPVSAASAPPSAPPPRPSINSVLQALPSMDFEALSRCQRQSASEMSQYESQPNSSIILEQIPLPSGSSVLCDISCSPARPIIPSSMVQEVFACVHGLAHQGSNATLADAKRRYLWHNMSSDIRRLCRSCVACQRSKILRHTRAPLQDLPLPDRRFDVLHLSLIHI